MVFVRTDGLFALATLDAVLNHLHARNTIVSAIPARMMSAPAETLPFMQTRPPATTHVVWTTANA